MKGMIIGRQSENGTLIKKGLVVIYIDNESAHNIFFNLSYKPFFPQGFDYNVYGERKCRQHIQKIAPLDNYIYEKSLKRYKNYKQVIQNYSMRKKQFIWSNTSSSCVTKKAKFVTMNMSKKDKKDILDVKDSWNCTSSFCINMYNHRSFSCSWE